MVGQRNIRGDPNKGVKVKHVFKNIFLNTKITTYGLVLESKKTFMAGLQGEAGGDVRFNSEGDAVSNAHVYYLKSNAHVYYLKSNALTISKPMLMYTISKAMLILSQKQCSNYLTSNALTVSKAMLMYTILKAML